MITKLYLTMALLLSVVITNAQINKGAVLLGGQIYDQHTNVNYTSTGNLEEKQDAATFNVSVGKAFKENAVYGITIAYSPSSQTNDPYAYSYAKTKTDAYSAGLFFRQYKNIAKDLYFFVQGDIAYISSKQTNTDITGTKTATIKQSGGSLSVTPGIAYKIFRKCQLELTLPGVFGVQYTTTNDDESQMQLTSNKQKQFSFNANLNGSLLSSLGVGFRFIL